MGSGLRVWCSGFRALGLYGLMTVHGFIHMGFGGLRGLWFGVTFQAFRKDSICGSRLFYASAAPSMMAAGALLPHFGSDNWPARSSHHACRWIIFSDLWMLLRVT